MKFRVDFVLLNLALRFPLLSQKISYINEALKTEFSNIRFSPLGSESRRGEEYTKNN